VKDHYETLDGLRGTAALCVLLFHFLELATPDRVHNPLRHAPLAVDFFFALSGFVMGYAYDARLRRQEPSDSAAGPRMSVKSFLLRRLIRLHPMVVAAMTLGLLSYLFDPFVGPRPSLGGQASPILLALVFGLSLLLLPAPALPNRFGETYPLDSPAWSLLQEYVGSVFYSLIGCRLSQPVLIILAVFAAVALLLTGLHFGDLIGGWDWETFWVAPVRLAYPLLAGLWLSRSGFRRGLRGGYIWLSLVLILMFAVPSFGKLDGLYEPLCVIVGVPLILYFGAGAKALGGVLGSVCRFTGRMSYPVYIIHYPFLYIFVHWKDRTQPPQMAVWAAAAGTYAVVILLAWVLLTYYDEPVRRWLSRWRLQAELNPRSLRDRQVAAPVDLL
jgi:peptidoglycan/LPS O-acetylase OafA/YrhL